MHCFYCAHYHHHYSYPDVIMIKRYISYCRHVQGLRAAPLWTEEETGQCHLAYMQMIMTTEMMWMMDVDDDDL